MNNTERQREVCLHHVLQLIFSLSDWNSDTVFEGGEVWMRACCSLGQPGTFLRWCPIAFPVLHLPPDLLSSSVSPLHLLSPFFSYFLVTMTTTLDTMLAHPDQELSPERLDGCGDPGGRYKVVPSVVCSMCCLFGIIYCFFGYRCFKAVMFLTGLMFGSVVIFMLCYKERVLDTQLSVEASVGIGLGIGTLCGLVTMLVRSVGLFMVGLLLGLLVAVATLVGMEELSDSPPRSVWVPLGVLLGLGMLFAVLTLQWQRLFTTLSTAVFGAAVITVAVDYFVELFALVLYMYERMKAAPGKPVCWLTWVVLGVWPALTLLGVIVQWKVTAEGYSHTKVIISRQQRRMQVMRIRQRDDRYRKKKKKQQHGSSSTHHHQAKQLHAEPAYRRKPNPIRRYDTDVLSPSYIQSFRDRQVQGQPFPSRLVGGPHAVVDVGYDCGSTAPLTGAAGPSLRV